MPRPCPLNPMSFQIFWHVGLESLGFLNITLYGLLQCNFIPVLPFNLN